MDAEQTEQIENALQGIADAIHDVGRSEAVGGSLSLAEGLDSIASAIGEHAAAVRELAEAVRESR